ncbi:murein hydrolase activator EnvC family protein [Caldicellulosiruptor morganii]|uniref:Peptidoglycan DD-metalloendopeptidase family protein n=1 Tax=Caldicellulosiruptor morganii TaxID=1387555 RepID=A0ABY7BR92_9FIRM|nr:M23 family metallopeptidase [Caldicellulosiruptor morganii]WAM34601.1 peptidoglycan DD-metalloendopeptidase family protein [Caldicellulosiruptor morganii]
MFKKSSFLVLFLVFVLIFEVAVSDTLRDYQNKLKSVEKDKKVTQKKIVEIKNRQQQLLDQIDEIDKKIDRTKNQIEFLKNNILIVENKIKNTVKQLQIQQAKKEAYYQKFKDRIRAIYEMNNVSVSYVEILLDSKNLSDFFTRMYLFNDIIEYDKQILNEYTKTIEEIKKKKTELVLLKQDLNEKKKELEVNQYSLIAEQQEKKKLLTYLEKEQNRLEKILDELEEISNELSKKIKEILAKQKTKRIYSGGKLLWPVDGYYDITSYFGMRFHPILKKNKMHTGIDIGAPYNARVLAAADGDVILAGWISGYGKTIILDNGSGISTLYAHLSSINVSVGQKVKRGECIGNVGSTGYSTGPHLHFEVRINGDVVDPLNYLK